METDFKYHIGDTVEGVVSAIEKTSIYIDLSPFGTGIIYGSEFLVARDILRKTKIGDKISAKIIEIETKDGYIDLSLKEARKAAVWKEVEESYKLKRTYEVTIKNANRGGLVADWNTIRGFLPASQLSPKNYPRLINSTKENILNELKKLIGKKLKVNIEKYDEKEETLIFSEVNDEGAIDSKDESDKEIKIKYNIGDVKTGVVTGVVDFGIFIKVDNEIEGLVHISEIDWGLVGDPRSRYSLGNQLKVKIIKIDDNGKYSFSIKALHKNPWDEINEKYKVGDVVSGVVIKYGEHGAFASIEAGVTGLVHISNFKNEETLRSELEIGKIYKFKISNLETKEQKLILNPVVE